ncbi:MAG: hypothetical protein NW207_04840 [Cytophagales bacterium]|nr:hypothetical protein [Cytophagales bacterium]
MPILKKNIEDIQTEVDIIKNDVSFIRENIAEIKTALRFIDDTESP